MFPAFGYWLSLDWRHISQIYIRAADLTIHSTFSTSYTALAGIVISTIYACLRQRNRHPSRRDWMDAMRADWSKNIKDGFIALTCWYVFMFACNVYVANQREAQVFGAEFGEQGTTSTEIRRKIEADGYVFAAKYPGMAVNEALNALEEDKRAFVAAKRGIAKVWTRTGSKEPTE